MTDAAAGPLFAVAALLGVAGLAKLARPASTVTALRAAGLPGPRAAGRVLGAAEVVLAGLVIATGSRASAVALAVAYLAFAVFTARLIERHGAAADCGCFGAERSPATRFHVAADLFAAGLAGLAVASPPGGIADIVADQPLAGVPFLGLVAVATWLGHTAYTLLPVLAEAARDGDGGRR